MPWFWFSLMLLALLIGNSADSVTRWAGFFEGMVSSDPNLLVLLGPTLCAPLLAKVWMIYIGRYVESGELSHETASMMWEYGVRWATIMGALLLIVLEPFAGVTNQVIRAREYSETCGAFLALGPLILFALMMDSLAYQWEKYRQLTSEVAETRSALHPLRILWLKAQFSWFIPLVPMFVSCLGVDLLKLVVSEESLQQWAILFVPVLSLLVAILVGTLVLTLSTESMIRKHPQGKQWQQMFQEIGAPVRDIRILYTDNQISNAMLFGGLSCFRYVILTDKLLVTLTTRELEMVLLHEAAHSQCRHVLKRWLVLAVGLAILVTAFQGWSWGMEALDTWNVGESVSGMIWRICYWGGLACLFLTSLALAWGARGIWHRTEMEADRVACQIAVQRRQGEFEQGTAADVQCWNVRRQQWKSAMELSAALHNLVGSEQRAARDTWTHPSVKTRVRKLADWFALDDR